MTAAPEPSDEELLARYPDVGVDHVNKDFYRGLLASEVRMNRCRDCGHWHHPPMPICPECWSKNLEATPIAGRGTIHLVMFLHQGPPAEGVTYDPPHPVVTVELDEQPGLRMTSTVVGADEDAISIGKRVRLDWITRNDRPLPVWRLEHGER